MSRLLLKVLVLFSMLAGMPALAQDRIEVIELKHRPAAEVASIVRPLLGPRDALTVEGYTLILRAEPARIEQIRGVVQQIDRAPRNLMVSVRRATQDEAARTEAEARARVSSGKATGEIGGQEDDGARVSVDQRYTTRRETNVQRLRVLEGNRAFIEVGESFPYPSASIGLYPWGTVATGGIDYKSIGTGFVVLPRINGKTVMLEVEQVAERRRPSDGSIAHQSSSTVLSGRVGEWIAIGGATRSGDSQSSRVYSTRRDHAGDELSIFVRVEPAD